MMIFDELMENNEIIGHIFIHHLIDLEVLKDYEGQGVVLNFWGTWCTPCVNELPYFEQIANEYKENVAVIAIHSEMLKETAPAYIKEHYPNSDLIFACDTENAGYYTTLGGRGTYPYTVILDENGISYEMCLYERV